ncbi:hypothetical protein [Alicyclobacillus dauci]|uniref:Uncharacterized protein n=1 Tax=Alicyclobacillus dauci TaxID=1475485 RepID=A0ABY6Z232_9BACL|nr:hypothetical protein [Alicyclobacillus dauci]WAH36658.1 hypothetical protein NZD86_21190 [Alicyclobacillus dauci]
MHNPFESTEFDPVTMADVRHHIRSATKCRRCRVPSTENFCTACQVEFSKLASWYFQIIDRALSVLHSDGPFEEHRKAYRIARTHLRRILRLKSYGLTFRHTKTYRVRLREAAEKLSIEKAVYRLNERRSRKQAEK